MLESLKHLFDLIFDNSQSWGKKSSILFSIFFVLIVADFTFNISFNIFTENKLSQLAKINILKKDYSNDENKLKEILIIEKEVFKREHYSEFINRNFINLTENQKVKSIEVNKKTKKVSLFWMVLSSNTVLIFSMLIMFLLPIFGSKENRQGSFFIGMFASLFFISFIIVAITFIAYQIPILDNNPKWNYLLNFLIQIFFYSIIFWIVSKNQKKNVA